MRFLETQRFSLLLAMCVLLSACGTNPYSLPRVETREPSYEEPAPPPEPVAPAPEPVPSGAYSGLLDRAAEARNRGDYDQALAYRERAQRIDPANAEIYLALAQTHAAAGNGGQASAVAERGLLYCSGSRQCDALRKHTR